MLMNGIHSFPRQEKLIYGRAADEVLLEDSEQSGWRRAFVVTSRSVGETPFFRRLAARLGGRIAGLYAGVAAHSPAESVLEGSNAARAAGADVLIAVGGGSVIDATKVMQACLWTDLQTEADLDRYRERPATQSATPALRMVAVPTTLSAAEFTPIAGITDTGRGIKHIFADPYLIPRLVILDPEATLWTPDRLFLATGLRAVDHCVETLCSISPTPYGDAMAREGLRLLTEGLRAAKADPGDLAARLRCQLGAWMAISGPVSGVPVGASHAIGRVLGAACDVPHGETSCVLLAGTLVWNASHDNGAQSVVASVMGAPALSAAETVRALVSELGLPGSLAAVGVSADRYDEIAEKSMVMVQSPSTSGNRRPIGSADDIKEILALVAG